MATLDPIVALQVAGSIGHSASALGTKGKLSSVKSVCWIGNNNRGQDPSLHDDDDHASDGAAVRDDDDGDSTGSDDEDGDEPIRFACDRVAQERGVVESAPPSLVLSRRYLVSCHADGTSHLWDLERQRIAQEFVPPRGGPGLLVRRIDDCGGNKEDDSRLMYQTRDPEGTVSCHRLDAGGGTTAVQETDRLETHSQTFCAASPCRGNRHLIALPTYDDTAAVVRDWRVSPSSSPVASIQTFAAAPAPGTTSQSRYGMLTSLALTEIDISGGSTRGARPMLACGMESGHVLLYDLGMTGTSPSAIMEPHSLLALGKDPVLTLDMVPSKLPTSSSSLGSLVTIAGLAGSSDDLATLPESEQGRVAVLKSSLDSDHHAWHCRLRARLATCRIPRHSDSMPTIAGKPGVSICRFRPDGQLFAVGGWDKRVRIFDRAASGIRDHSAPRALLRGHSTSVTALDWAPDAVHSGLLATGGNDGRIFVWKCCGSSTNSNQ